MKIKRIDCACKRKGQPEEVRELFLVKRNILWCVHLLLPTASLLVAPPAIQTQIHQCHHNFILETNQHVTLNLLTIPDWLVWLAGNNREGVTATNIISCKGFMPLLFEHQEHGDHRSGAGEEWQSLNGWNCKAADCSICQHIHASIYMLPGAYRVVGARELCQLQVT